MSSQQACHIEGGSAGLIPSQLLEEKRKAFVKRDLELATTGTRACEAAAEPPPLIMQIGHSLRHTSNKDNICSSPYRTSVSSGGAGFYSSSPPVLQPGECWSNEHRRDSGGPIQSDAY